MKKILIFIFLLLLIVVFAVNYFGEKTETKRTPIVEKIAEVILPTPTPFLFRELTIPYLRERKYESKLAELTAVNNNQNYSSYITSYESDGLKINGLITKPSGDEPADGWPAIIFIHGYIPPKQYQTQERYIDHVNYLARNGFVVYKIDLRGHGNSEGEASGAYYSTDYVIDTLNAYAALESTSFVNPKKIGLWGHSMAGNVVMRSAAAKPTIPAVVIWAGAVYSYVDLQQYRINDNSYVPPLTTAPSRRRRQQIIDVHGEISEDNQFWKQVAATTYLNDLTTAIQLNHAKNDDVVSIEYSRNLNRLLDKTSVAHELHEYNSGGHNISDASFAQAMQNTVNFFNKNLKEM